MRVRVCCIIHGVAFDDDGNPATAGLALDFGESDSEILYEDLIKNIDVDALLKNACLNDLVKPEDVEFISPEEYDREFGNDEE